MSRCRTWAELYIHYDKQRSFGVLHSNLKSSKILLDEQREAKISGFELSKTNPVARQHGLVLDSEISGTYAYVDAAYVKSGGVTLKSDVYALGVILMEVMCGKKAFISDSHELTHLCFLPIALVMLVVSFSAAFGREYSEFSPAPAPAFDTGAAAAASMMSSMAFVLVSIIGLVKNALARVAIMNCEEYQLPAACCVPVSSEPSRAPSATMMHLLVHHNHTSFKSVIDLGFRIVGSIGQTLIATSGNIMAEREIDNLTMEQYLSFTRRNQASGVVKPEIRGNVNFKIKSQFMRELREDNFFETRMTMLMSMLSDFYTSSVCSTFKELSTGTVNSWDLLKKAFIQRYYPPSNSAKQFEEIRNFKQKGIWIAVVTQRESLLLFFDNERQETNKSRIEEALATLDITPKIKQMIKASREKSISSKDYGEPKEIKINCPLLKEIRQIDNYAKHIKDLVANKKRTKEDVEIRMNPGCSALLQNQLLSKEHNPMKIRYGKVCKMTRDRILRDHSRERFEDDEYEIEENLEDSEECGEDKASVILGIVLDKLDEAWFEGTSEDKDDLEGMLDFLEPKSYVGFID
uniref:Kinase-like domain-containing protein n=1 Tax=Tanacetum cinerariifolium TaxID=118510 RepID=A0A6L2LZK3_TANCI|nr:kinase-like domain-containing protein [Tanacetum cinerariifolium]